MPAALLLYVQSESVWWSPTPLWQLLRDAARLPVGYFPLAEDAFDVAMLLAHRAAAQGLDVKVFVRHEGADTWADHWSTDGARTLRPAR